MPPAEPDRLAAALGGFPRVPLGVWPTPVEPLPGLGLPPGAPVWVKREDLASPLYGGNKVRKLELLLAEGSGPVVTFGAPGSHHVLATAVHAAPLGRRCRAVLVGRPRTGDARDVLALNEALCESVVRTDRPLAALRALGGLVAGGPGVIAPGGSSPLGTLGWVAGGLELAAQIREGACPAPDEIWVAYGSGGTAVGLALGLALAGARCEVIAVRTATRLAGNRAYAALLARRTFSLLDRPSSLGPMPKLRLVLEHRFAGPGYGSPTPEGEDAARRARDAGIPIEPTYTAKALAALLAAARRGPEGRTRMFLDTTCPIDKLGAVPKVSSA